MIVYYDSSVSSRMCEMSLDLTYDAGLVKGLKMNMLNYHGGSIWLAGWNLAFITLTGTSFPAS